MTFAEIVERVDSVNHVAENYTKSATIVPYQEVINDADIIEVVIDSITTRYAADAYNCTIDSSNIFCDQLVLETLDFTKELLEGQQRIPNYTVSFVFSDIQHLVTLVDPVEQSSYFSSEAKYVVKSYIDAIAESQTSYDRFVIANSYESAFGSVFTNEDERLLLQSLFRMEQANFYLDANRFGVKANVGPCQKAVFKMFIGVAIAGLLADGPGAALALGVGVTGLANIGVTCYKNTGNG